MVLNQIKYFQNEYRDGVPYRILKLDLDLSEMELKDILNLLDEKEIVSYRDGNVTILKTDGLMFVRMLLLLKRKFLTKQRKRHLKL